MRSRQRELAQEPALTEHEGADVRGFLHEMLRILPLVELRTFETPKPIVAPSGVSPAPFATAPVDDRDTIIVPAKKDGFEKVFLGENSWHAIRISGSMLERIKHIAAYQAQPVSAITHLARVKQIEPYGEAGKYRIIFHGPATEFRPPIPFSDATSGSLQGPRYTSIVKLKAARKVSDLF